MTPPTPLNLAWLQSPDGQEWLREQLEIADNKSPESLGTRVYAACDHYAALIRVLMVQTWDAAERLRLFDLVRFCRHKLFEENLITPEEFSDILAEGSVSAPDGGSVRRLESYDQMRQCITALEAERDALKAEIIKWKAAYRKLLTGIRSRCPTHGGYIDD